MAVLYKQDNRTIGNASEGAKASQIKNRLLSDFYHHNDYSLKHDPYYDEPTYLSFRIGFNFTNPSSNDNLNDMPMPLLGIPEYDLKKYNTYTYLLDQKENIRAKDLTIFREKLMDIEHNYPFYFKSIEGLNNLLKVNTTSGRRLKEGENILTIKCLEGLDLKITELINLYRKIAWDDVYQRWVLPDMMRYFQMRIFISEIRNFHTNINSPKSTKTSSLGSYANRNNFGGQILNKIENTAVVNKVKNIVNDVTSTIEGFTKTTTNAWELINNEINNYMPTLCITCNQCEFVIDDMMSNFGTFNSVNRTPFDDLTFRIKVGNIMESQYYPLDNFDYEKTELHTSLLDEELMRPTNTNWDEKNTELSWLYGITQDRNYFGGEINDVAYSSIPNSYIPFDKSTKGGLLDSVVGEITENLLDSAIGHIDRKATELLNRGLNARLGNTNLTVQGMYNALNSKNILTMYSYVRDSINQEMNTNAAAGSAATSGQTDISNYAKELRKDAQKLPTSEATKNIYDILDASTRNKIIGEYDEYKNDISTLAKSKATDASNFISPFILKETIKHSELGDKAFIDFLKEVAKLPKSEATSDQIAAIDIANILVKANLKTVELDDLFETNEKTLKEMYISFNELKKIYNKLPKSEATINNYDELDGKTRRDLVGETIDFKRKADKLNNSEATINNYDELDGKTRRDLVGETIDTKKDYDKLPKSEAIENIVGNDIMTDEYSNLISDLRKMSLSTATDIEDKEVALDLYQVFKEFKEESEQDSVKKTIGKILDEVEDEEKRKTIIKFVEETKNSRDLDEVLHNLAKLKNSVDIPTLDENRGSKIPSEFEDQRDNYNSLPMSEAVENTYQYEEVDPHYDQKDEYNSLPMSEAVENTSYTNDMTYVDPSANLYEKTTEINGFNDVKQNNVNNIWKSDINGFDGLENNASKKQNYIDGFEDLKNISSEKIDYIDGFSELQRSVDEMTNSEATEHNYDEMDPAKRNAIISEYKNLKNE